MTSPRPVITGGRGFLGWHLACRLHARCGLDAELIGRLDAARLEEAIAAGGTVYHLAGVNRAETDADVIDGNLAAAEMLAGALRAARVPAVVVFANSIQAAGDTPYGRGKRAAADIVRRAVADCGGRFVDVWLPNVFGEHGRPAYNSFVATFADAVVAGRDPVVHEDRVVPLLPAQDAAQALIDAGTRELPGRMDPPGHPRRVTEVLALLRQFDSTYRSNGELPALPDHFTVALFNTYRSFLFPQGYPIHPVVHTDDRGDLMETFRSHGGTGMGFVSTTRPGRRRGDHYHLAKVERFFVVQGEAEIALRRLLSTERVTFRLSGDQPGFVDMPTLWVHAITNVGHDDLVTAFWADQLLDPHDPDQYPEAVGSQEGTR